MIHPSGLNGTMAQIASHAQLSGCLGCRLQGASIVLGACVSRGRAMVIHSHLPAQRAHVGNERRCTLGGMAAEDPTCVFLDGTVLCDAGEVITMKWKAWPHPMPPEQQGRLHVWEVRRILISMEIGGKRPIHKVLNDEAAVWSVMFEQVGLPRPNYIASRRSLKDLTGIPEALVHDEASLTTPALILVLLQWCGCRRKKEHRRRALHMLAAYLQHAMPDGRIACLVDFEAPDGILEACGGMVPGGEGHGLCEHLSGLQGEWGRRLASESNYAMRVATLLLLLFVGRDVCGGARHWLLHMVLKAAAGVDKSLPEQDLPTDALRHGILPGGQKRRRLDEDMRRAVADVGRTGGGAATGAEWCRVDGQLSRQHGHSLQLRSLREYQATAWLSWRDCRYLSIAFDGSRLGEPALDMLIILGWSEDKQCGFWCAPQASDGGHLRGGGGKLATGHACR